MPSAGQPTGRIAAGIVAGAIREAAASGLDAGALWELVGVDPSEGLAEVQVPLASHFGLWEHIMRTLDDPSMPVRVGSARRTGDLQVRGFAAATSTSGWEAIERGIRFARLTTDTMRVSLKERGAGRVRLELERDGPRTLGHRCANECALTAWVAQLRSVLDPAFAPLNVMLRHPSPPDTTAHGKFFRAPVDFDASIDGIDFDPAVLDCRPANSNPEMRAFFDRQAEQLLAKLGADDPRLVVEVKHSVAGCLASGPPKIADVARASGISERALRRRLKDAGTSYTALVADVRLELGRHLLRSPKLSLTEIAFALGFSEHSAFSRFFRRVSGMSPQDFRARERADAG